MSKTWVISIAMLASTGSVFATTLWSDAGTSSAFPTNAQVGAGPSAFQFVSDGSDYDTTLLSADTGAAGTVFGYYVGSTLTPLYTLSLTGGSAATVTFDPGTGNTFGFYSTVCSSLGVCDTDTTGGAGSSHFALIQSTSGDYVIGFTGQNSSDTADIGGFDDVAIDLHPHHPVPEPANLALVGAGLLALCLFRRR